MQDSDLNGPAPQSEANISLAKMRLGQPVVPYLEPHVTAPERLVHNVFIRFAVSNPREDQNNEKKTAQGAAFLFWFRRSNYMMLQRRR
ncbi:hypothetical protein V1277_001745 [Bradyrhizobium sp. AZCC 1588]|uniref:hypothetical protein n=1 Tax=unclassified Bradyrhizobium TaxID=2631580 RepID=UPI002FF17655